MRFPTAFSRFKGTVPDGKIELGSEGAVDDPPTSPPNPNQDNALASKFYSNQGWPAHRIAVGYKGPPGSIPLDAQVWVYDTKTEAWYAVGDAGTVKPNQITYFDVVALLDMPTTATSLDSPTQGSLSVLLVIQGDAGAPDGEHVFAFGADLTVLPV